MSVYKVYNIHVVLIARNNYTVIIALLHFINGGFCSWRLAVNKFSLIFINRQSLDRLVADHFPVKSTDLSESNSYFKDYVAAIDRVGIQGKKNKTIKSTVTQNTFS